MLVEAIATGRCFGSGSGEQAQRDPATREPATPRCVLQSLPLLLFCFVLDMSFQGSMHCLGSSVSLQARCCRSEQAETGGGGSTSASVDTTD